MREDGRGAIQVRKSTRVTRKLGIDYPILQGPFAGVPSHRLAAIVSNKGGLGAIGAHGLEGLAIREAVDQVRSQTNRPFAVNLWVSTSDPGIARIDSEATSSYISALATYYAELGTEPPSSLHIQSSGLRMPVSSCHRCTGSGPQFYVWPSTCRDARRMSQIRHSDDRHCDHA